MNMLKENPLHSRYDFTLDRAEVVSPGELDALYERIGHENLVRMLEKHGPRAVAALIALYEDEIAVAWAEDVARWEMEMLPDPTTQEIPVIDATPIADTVRLELADLAAFAAAQPVTEALEVIDEGDGSEHFYEDVIAPRIEKDLAALTGSLPEIMPEALRGTAWVSTPRVCLGSGFRIGEPTAARVLPGTGISLPPLDVEVDVVDTGVIPS